MISGDEFVDVCFEMLGDIQIRFVQSDDTPEDMLRLMGCVEGTLKGLMNMLERRHALLKESKP